MPIVPLHDNVLIRLVDPNKNTPGGIVIPETVKPDDIVEGEVVAAGIGRRLDNGTFFEADVKPGDRVLFSKKYALEVRVPRNGHFEEQKLILVTGIGVLCVLSTKTGPRDPFNE
jgi:chaperonin GroES